MKQLITVLIVSLFLSCSTEHTIIRGDQGLIVESINLIEGNQWVVTFKAEKGIMASHEDPSKPYRDDSGSLVKGRKRIYIAFSGKVPFQINDTVSLTKALRNIKGAVNNNNNKQESNVVINNYVNSILDAYSRRTVSDTIFVD